MGMFEIPLGLILDSFYISSPSHHPNYRFTSGFTPSEPEDGAARTLSKDEEVQMGSSTKRIVQYSVTTFLLMLLPPTNV